MLHLTAYTPWYVSVERVARDKAGELGANCLTKRSTWGAGSYPFTVSYDAFRLTHQWGFGLRAPWFPIPKKEMADAAAEATSANPSSASPAASSSPSPAPVSATSASGQPDTPLWMSGNFIFRFVIGMDTAKFSPAVWQDIQQDFKEYFSASQYAHLLDAHRRGRRILVDFKDLKITEVP
ncbi:MAG: hypothetical protein KGM24_02625 [Elusimicrobia bacterium]|nr:hypothetical protein [Elusimicrobiota bacterium]